MGAEEVPQSVQSVTNAAGSSGRSGSPFSHIQGWVVTLEPSDRWLSGCRIPLVTVELFVQFGAGCAGVTVLPWAHGCFPESGRNCRLKPSPPPPRPSRSPVSWLHEDSPHAHPPIVLGLLPWLVAILGGLPENSRKQKYTSNLVLTLREYKHFEVVQKSIKIDIC